MIPGPGTYERARPIFRPSRRTFHPLASVASWRREGVGVHLQVPSRGGPLVHVRASVVSERTVRVQWRVDAAPERRRTEMLAGSVPELPVNVEETSERLLVSGAGAHPLVIEKRPWQLRFGPYRSEPHDASIVEWVAEPSGVAEEDGHWTSHETFALEAGEELYGLGERFLGPALRGRRLSHWISEPYGTNTTDLVYKSVPLVVSSRGYGLFFHHAEEATFDLGASSTASASVLVDSPEMDMFVMLGTPKQVLAEYTALTGRPALLPDWTFGIWMSRCMYENRAQLAEVLDEARRHECDVEVVNVDPLWLRGRRGWQSDACDFIADEEAFGPVADLAAWLHAQGVHLCLWLNPHVMDSSPAWRPDRLVEGGRARDTVDPHRGFVDFTGAGAEWWDAEVRRLVDAGVDCFKLDYGESLPADVVMADGRSGAQVHNLYPLLAATVVAEAGALVAFTRAGTAGSQRHPLHWSGDAQSTWAGMAGALRGGLAASWSGFAFWTTDIGGFHRRDLYDQDGPTAGFGQPSEELYIRWMQMGMLLSHTRFHGTGRREPWHFGETALRVYRELAALRRALRSYLLECAREAASTGSPVMRPLAMEFPDDPGSRHVDTQFMLGPALLVCPVLRPGGGIDIYLPPGGWTGHATGEHLEGSRWLTGLQVPLEHVPLYIRDGHAPLPSR